MCCAMSKPLLLSILLPIIAGSTAGQGNLQDFYKKGIVYRENTQSIFSSEVKNFINNSMKEKSCNPFARYKIQREFTYPITDLQGQTVMVYTVELRVFEEAEKNSFNGYEAGNRFRKREVTVRQNDKDFSITELNCEKTGWQRTRL